MRKLFCWMLLGLSAAGARAAPEAAVRRVRALAARLSHMKASTKHD